MLPRLSLLLICSLITLITCAQTKNDIPGKWKTVKVLLPADFKKNDPAACQRVEKAMINTKFQFNGDGTCSFDFPEMPSENYRWTFNEKEKTITVIVVGEKGMLMKLTVSQKNNKWYFAVFETPAILEVKKINSR